MDNGVILSDLERKDTFQNIIYFIPNQIEKFVNSFKKLKDDNRKKLDLYYFDIQGILDPNSIFVYIFISFLFYFKEF